MDLVAHSRLDHVSYILILYSLAFLMFLFVNMLVGVYDRAAGGPAAAHQADDRPSMRNRTGAEGRQLRDAEEFELDGLMSDDEDEEQASRRKLLKDETDDVVLASPSTLGRNSDRVAS